MLVGGIDAHRYDLSSMIMLKDNHISSHGSISSALRAARSVGGFSLLVDVEVGSLEEAHEAVQAGADVVMLDNFDGDDLVNAAAELRERWGLQGGTGRRFLLETSGGIDEANLKKRAINGG